ncbi:tetratricopeptide repeat protein [Salinicola aestuarinus]|uniref:tetratricopeptide repeat protein n=1 Tax=Salinicola aestuarinus TaxID=1949082 RepID=UPI000DA21CF4|nr:tetratricopeptide repeat protein [Salinicola aestuarinus]
MPQASSLFTRFEFRLATQLSHVGWIGRSPSKQRLMLKWFKRCADAGHLPARSLYGRVLLHRGVSAKDKSTGARYVLQAAREGDLNAQYQAGRIYELGCTQYQPNLHHAVTWYARAGDNGHSLAADRLATAYQFGELGLPCDPSRAEEWSELALNLSSQQPVLEAPHPAPAVL